jgi:hypothetical protein
MKFPVNISVKKPGITKCPSLTLLHKYFVLAARDLVVKIFMSDLYLTKQKRKK